MAMVIYDGRLIAFGPREEIFARVAQSNIHPVRVQKRSGPRLSAGGVQ
jgi:ABC-type protease/lipase transport system fused ATPase/permease subunit